jgi:hypothetical protein
MLWHKTMGAGGLVGGGGVSFVGEASAGGFGTITIPAHSSGDLIIVADHNALTTNRPSTISGFTSVAQYTTDTFGSTQDRGIRLQYQFDTSNSINSVTLSGGGGGVAWVFTGVDSFVQTVAEQSDSSSPFTNWDIDALSGMTSGNFLFVGSYGSTRTLSSLDTGWSGNIGGEIAAWITELDGTSTSSARHIPSDSFFDAYGALEFSKL